VLMDQAVAPLSKCAYETGLTERAKPSDVVVDEVHVQRHHVPAKELPGSLFVARSGRTPFKRCQKARGRSRVMDWWDPISGEPARASRNAPPAPAGARP